MDSRRINGGGDVEIGILVCAERFPFMTCNPVNGCHRGVPGSSETPISVQPDLGPQGNRDLSSELLTIPGDHFFFGDFHVFSGG